jgi:hypothetical protein
LHGTSEVRSSDAAAHCRLLHRPPAADEFGEACGVSRHVAILSRWTVGGSRRTLERVAEGHWALGHRVIVEDMRRDDTFMRVTWHESARVFVVSHWRGEVCIAATRVPVDAAPDLISLFVRGLADSAGQSSEISTQGRDNTSFVERIKQLVRRHSHRAA